MTSRLDLYNSALLHIGERKLDSLTENRKPRRILDKVWDDGFIEGVLEDGLWNFGTRTIRSDFDPSITPDFGYKYAHTKPNDWLRTSAISIDEYVLDPLVNYVDEAGYWWTDHEVIFVRFVSSDASYGGDLSAWPDSVVDYAELKLAAKIAVAMTQDYTLAELLDRKAAKQLLVAKARDAAGDPPKFTPAGSWVRSRSSRGRGYPPSNIRTR